MSGTRVDRVGGLGGLEVHEFGLTRPEQYSALAEMKLDLAEIQIVVDVLEKGWAVNWELMRTNPEALKNMLDHLVQRAAELEVGMAAFFGPILLEGYDKGVISKEVLLDITKD